jgi:predicted nucleotidyltransferase
MLVAAADDVAQALAGALTGRADVEVAILFGSRARGDARSDSDVDVAVVGAVDRLTLAANLSRATGHEVDVVDLTAAGFPLLAAIVKDGLLVHEGARSAYGRWLSRALFELELDRPAYTRMRNGYLAKLAEGAGR